MTTLALICIALATLLNAVGILMLNKTAKNQLEIIRRILEGKPKA